MREYARAHAASVFCTVGVFWMHTCSYAINSGAFCIAPLGRGHTACRCRPITIVWIRWIPAERLSEAVLGGEGWRKFGPLQLTIYLHRISSMVGGLLWSGVWCGFIKSVRGIVSTLFPLCFHFRPVAYLALAVQPRELSSRSETSPCLLPAGIRGTK